AEQGQFDRPAARARGHHLDGSAAVPGALDEAFLLQVREMLVNRCERRKAETATDFLEAGRVAVLPDEVVEIVENLALALGEGKFRGHSSIATWLYWIAVNVSLNRVSAKAVPSEPIADRQFVDEDAESASDRLLRTERGAKVRAAIAQLPAKQRATLILRMY